MKENLFNNNSKIEINTNNKKITVKKDKLIIAGPCAIESYEQLLETAKFVKSQGANILRGGAYKPRTSPNSFQGLKKEGLEILKAVKDEVGMAVITELMDVRDMDELYSISDIIQIGSRNMQNFTLLSEVGKQNKPVMLKRGIASTITEWIGASEYIAIEGNSNIIMCERGIRTYNDYTDDSEELKKCFELEVIDLVNSVRNQRGLNSLRYSEQATLSSRKHSEDMRDNNFFDHVNKKNETPFDRMKREGIVYTSAGENIAAGQINAIYAHEAWMNSEGHRKNILGNYNNIGVGVIFGGSYKTYYTQNFYK